jgi:hypothetical protein
MQNRNRGRYEIADSEVVAEGSDMRVSVLTLAAGQCVPWHYHNEISDSFVCLEGPMVVETRATAKHLPLGAGAALRGAAKDGALRARRGDGALQIPDCAGRRDLRFRPRRLIAAAFPLPQLGQRDRVRGRCVTPPLRRGGSCAAGRPWRSRRTASPPAERAPRSRAPPRACRDQCPYRAPSTRT